jgi:AbrB family looped-hinge helix DNA binding protein
MKQEKTVQTSRISSKGQVTIPKDVRDAMGAGPSDEVEFTPLGDGRALISIRNKSVVSLFGMLKDRPRARKGPVSLEEMEEAIRTRRLEAGRAGLADEE